EGGDSRSTIESIVFVDPFAGTVQQHSLTLDGMGGISRTMGGCTGREWSMSIRGLLTTHIITPPVAFSAQQCPQLANDLNHNLVSNSNDKCCLSYLPIQALHLIGQDDTRDSNPLR